MKNTTDEFSFVLKPSNIPDAGVGIFAVHDIAKGTKLALMPDGGERRKIQRKKVPEELQHFCIATEDDSLYGPSQFNHLWIVWYINHSDEPNVWMDPEKRIYYAKRDIKSGEEICTDYNSFNEPEDKKESYYKKQI